MATFVQLQLYQRAVGKCGMGLLHMIRIMIPLCEFQDGISLSHADLYCQIEIMLAKQIIKKKYCDEDHLTRMKS